jgi:transcription antitermination factor NusG
VTMVEDFHSFGEAWYVAITKPRHEKVVEGMLRKKGVEVFLPISEQIRKYRSGRKIVRLPLFPRYLFVRFDPKEKMVYHRILDVPSLQGFIRSRSPGGVLLPASDEEVESLKLVVASGMPVAVLDGMEEGQRVRVLEGALKGAIGIISHIDRDQLKLTVNVTLLGKSVSVTLGPTQVEPA